MKKYQIVMTKQTTKMAEGLRRMEKQRLLIMLYQIIHSGFLNSQFSEMCKNTPARIQENIKNAEHLHPNILRILLKTTSPCKFMKGGRDGKKIFTPSHCWRLCSFPPFFSQLSECFQVIHLRISMAIDRLCNYIYKPRFLALCHLFK